MGQSQGRRHAEEQNRLGWTPGHGKENWTAWDAVGWCKKKDQSGRAHAKSGDEEVGLIARAADVISNANGMELDVG